MKKHNYFQDEDVPLDFKYDWLYSCMAFIVFGILFFVFLAVLFMNKFDL